MIQVPCVRRRVLRLLLSATGAALVPAVLAQPATYPQRPVKIVVAYAAGGANDLVARMLAQKLGAELGQNFFVENKPSAGGIVGTELVARAQPDGHTLLLGAGGALTINPSIYAKLPYNPQADFAPVTRFATSNLVVVVNPTLPVRNFGELVAHAARQPQGLNFASPGAGTPLHLAAEVAKRQAGIRMTHVPYKGSTPALTDLMSGQVDLMFDVVGTSLPHVRAGKLRALAVTGSRRDETLPEVPTLEEQGLKGFDVTVWYGLFAPAGTPAAVVQRLESAVARIAAMPDVREKLAAMGLAAAADGSAALARQVQEEIPRWQAVVKEAGVPVQ